MPLGRTAATGHESIGLDRQTALCLRQKGALYAASMIFYTRQMIDRRSGWRTALPERE
jgi:hypothetical protein